MAEALSVADAKRRFSEVIDRVTRGERFVITRRGRPVLALVPAADAGTEPKGPYLGLAAFAGALAEWPEFDDVMKRIVEDRRDVRDRPSPDLG